MSLTMFTCGLCGVSYPINDPHFCAGFRSSTGGAFPPPHQHIWAIGRIETEPVPAPGQIIGFYGRVVYLVCQCGAVKRAVPE
jgi:hypothetical protein